MNGDELDDAIDRGLCTYVAQRPPFGLEVRILRRIHRRESRLRITLAVAACTLLGIFAAQTGLRPVEKLTVNALSARIEVPPPTRLRVVRHKPRLTPGERALLRFVQDHPQQAIEVFARLDTPVSVDDIEIAPLVIEPLESQEENKK